MQFLRLLCDQQSLGWTRSYKVDVASVRRCPTMGSCVGGKCENVRRQEQLEELAEFWNFTGNSYCQEGEAVWGHQCAFPSMGTKECFFYKVYARPVDNVIWERVRCAEWRYEIVLDVKVHRGNISESKVLFLYPGRSRSWNEWTFLPAAVTPPMAPILDDQFLVSDEDVVFIGRDDVYLECGTKERAMNFSCDLGEDVCKECWLNRIEARMDCGGCKSGLVSDSDGKLPLSTPQINMRNEGKRVLSETEYAPVSLRISVEGLKLSTVVDGAKCWAEMRNLSGCYNCITGGVFHFECWADLGRAQAEVRCPGGLDFLAECGEGGIVQKITLPFDRANVRMECGLECPGGSSVVALNGELVYVPHFKSGESLGMAVKSKSSGFGWSFPDLSGLDWRNWLGSYLRVEYLPVLGGLLVIGVVVLYCWFSWSPMGRGYSMLMGTILVLSTLTGVSSSPFPFLSVGGGLQGSDGLLTPESISIRGAFEDGHLSFLYISFSFGAFPFPFPRSCLHPICQFILVPPNPILFFEQVNHNSSFLTTTMRIRLLEFFATEFRCSPSLVAVNLEFERRKQRAECMPRQALNNGAKMGFVLPGGPTLPVNTNAEIVLDFFWGRMPHGLPLRAQDYLREVGKRPWYRTFGPGLADGDVFFPLGGVWVDLNCGDEDNSSMVGEFWSLVQGTLGESEYDTPSEGDCPEAALGWGSESSWGLEAAPENAVVDVRDVLVDPVGVPGEDRGVVIKAEGEGVPPVGEPEEEENPSGEGAEPGQVELSAEIKVGGRVRARFSGVFLLVVVALLCLGGAVGMEPPPKPGFNVGGAAGNAGQDLLGRINDDVGSDEPGSPADSVLAEARRRAEEEAERARRTMEYAERVAAGLTAPPPEVVNPGMVQVGGNAGEMHDGGGVSKEWASAVAQQLVQLMPPGQGPSVAVQQRAVAGPSASSSGGGAMRRNRGGVAGPCFRCGFAGHVAAQCRASISIGDRREVAVASTSRAGETAMRLCPTDVPREVRAELGRRLDEAAGAIRRVGDLARDFNAALAATMFGFEEVMAAVADLCRSGVLRDKQ